MLIRLQKHLANLGYGSRRGIEKEISSGSVIVNGKLVTDQGTKINPETDNILYNGKKVRF